MNEVVGLVVLGNRTCNYHSARNGEHLPQWRSCRWPGARTHKKARKDCRDQSHLSSSDGYIHLPDLRGSCQLPKTFITVAYQLPAEPRDRDLSAPVE